MTAWQPSISLENLKHRAIILKQIRDFFEARGVLEVETPLACLAGVTDPYIENVTATIMRKKYYLQTSPEYAMKRLLAAGSGSIYQICKAFRDEESGRHHRPEFTMLEWYRVGFNHHDLMDEMDALLQTILNSKPAERLSYQELFLKYVAIDPLTCTSEQLKLLAPKHQINVMDPDSFDKDGWLNLFISHVIEPQLGHDQPTFIYDYPASQAALSKIREDSPPVAERFEVYIKGIELANGFHELLGKNEQQKRFESNLDYRKKNNLPLVPIDELLLGALEHGLPACAGVALGIDRLLMIALSATHIHEVLMT